MSTKLPEKENILLKCSVDVCDRFRIRCQVWCEGHYYQMRKYGKIVNPHIKQIAAKNSNQLQCTIDGCTKNRYVGGLCTMHYGQKRAGGIKSVERRKGVHGAGFINSEGYRIISIDHPLSNKSGQAREHRVVLYDHISPGTHKCNWCPTLVTWEDGTLKVDHLDFKRNNNAIDNLVPSCLKCNAGRQERSI